MLGVAALVTLLAGRAPVSIFIAVLVVAAYVDLRRLLAPRGHVLTLVLGGAGVAGFLWAGYSGRLVWLSATAAVLMLALLAAHLVLNEAAPRSVSSVGPGAEAPARSATSDVAATLGAAAATGVLGAHVLLIRSVERFGFRGLLAFGLMVIGSDVAAFAVGRLRGRRRLAPHTSPAKTWEGATAGFVTATVAGLVCGTVLDPPFTISSGLALGAGAGVFAPLGDLSFSAIKRSAGALASGSYLGPAGGALDAIDSVLFVAPAFYWAFRTLSL